MTDLIMQQLLRKYLDDTITEEELALLREIVLSEKDPGLQEEVIEKALRENRYSDVHPQEKDVLFSDMMEAAMARGRLAEEAQRQPGVRRQPLLRYAAAVLVLLAGASIYLLLNRTALNKK